MVAVVALGLVIGLGTGAAVLVGLDIAARTALGQAASAAALAAAQAEPPPEVTLAVSTTSADCGPLVCTWGPADVREVTGTPATLFTPIPGSPLPGWAAAAGCVAVDSAPSPGTGRICRGQQLVAIRPAPGGPTPVMRQVASAYFAANASPDLRDAEITSLRQGHGGEVLISASAGVSGAPWWRIAVTRMAWLGPTIASGISGQS